LSGQPSQGQIYSVLSLKKNTLCNALLRQCSCGCPPLSLPYSSGQSSQGQIYSVYFHVRNITVPTSQDTHSESLRVKPRL
jgi:hypothetical protein